MSFVQLVSAFRLYGADVLRQRGARDGGGESGDQTLQDQGGLAGAGDARYDAQAVPGEPDLQGMDRVDGTGGEGN